MLYGFGPETAQALYDMLKEYLGRTKYDHGGLRQHSRTIPNRAQLLTVTGEAGSEDAPHPDWYPAKLETLELFGDEWEAFEFGQVWAVSLNGEDLDIGRRYRALCVGLANYDDGSGGERLVYGVEMSSKLWGTLVGPLAQGGSARMLIRGDVESPEITVWDLLLLPGQSIAAGLRVTCFWDAVDGCWYVDATQCGTGGAPPPPPPGDCSGGNCLYRWSAAMGLWELVSAFCAEGCTCGPAPSTAGTYDQEIRPVLCQPIAPPPPSF